MNQQRVLGIDPGTARMGYGVLDAEGSRLRPVAFGCIETPAYTPVAVRLQMIYHELSALIARTRPEVMAIEQLFMGRNTTTAISVGQARGVALLAGAEAQLAIAEYTPMQVKQAVVGYGRADKGQVQEMVRVLLGLADKPRPDDAADALALAITHAHAAPIAERLRPSATDGGRRGARWP
ncbi:crossover junction endodeoxyribonuclease RuvC [Alicyclobacillus shizuokensis]|uniref:crossover junction endodeoxyribonuclease RuvC n=1 Tax=Alicyclobacillus shizuokensis TaxID=392014 RepID=UPI00082CDF09|nr:crossover junction endodeoxyribonuclease RuvC [Alicyclobacillus shizuokensis]